MLSFQNMMGVESINQICNYTLLETDDTFWDLVTPEYPISFYKQIVQSYFFSNMIAFDYLNEVAHNNVHNLNYGNMQPTTISSYSPFFILHHSAVEKVCTT